MSTLRTVAEDGRQVGVLTRDEIIEALREYAKLYGDDFPQGSFSPSQAKRNGRPELVDRYYKGRPDGRRWPSLNSIKHHFGSWNEARAAAGFKPNTTVPAGGRRAPGTAAPILEVRERLVFVPNERTKQLAARAHRLEERLLSAQRRAERAETTLREMRERRGAIPPPVGTVRTKTVTKTKTKIKRVKDERAVERLRSRLADADAARRAVEDQLKATERDRASAVRERSAVQAELADVRAEQAALAAEARAAEQAADRASDRLAGAEARVERLTAEVEAERERALGVTEAAAASVLVRAAEDRVQEAEARAARAEREMAEQAAAITGELRKLTQDELVELRARGPAGPAVLSAALKKLAIARKRGGVPLLKVALSEVARAAVAWNDRLR